MELVRIQSTMVIAEVIVTISVEHVHKWGLALLAKKLNLDPGNPSSTDGASTSGDANVEEVSNDELKTGVSEEERVTVRASSGVEGEHLVGVNRYPWVITTIVHRSSNCLYKS